MVLGFSTSTFPSDLRSRLDATASRLQRARVEADLIAESLESVKKTIEHLNQSITSFKMIEAYLSTLADERQAEVFKSLETTVTEGLQSIFQEDLRLEVTTKMVGSRSEVVFSIVSTSSEGELRTSVMDARGGGLAAVVGFLTQAVLILLTPGMRPFVALDETFRNVSVEYQEPLGQFVAELCEKTGLQVLLVTHQPEIAEYADTQYSFTQSDGITNITRVK